MLLGRVVPDGPQVHLGVQADDDPVDQNGQRVVAGRSQGGVEGHVIFLEAEGHVQTGLRALQRLPEGLGVLLCVMDGRQTGTAPVVDMAVLQQLVQIDGPHGHQVLQRLLHGLQGDAPDHRAAGATHGDLQKSLLLEHPQSLPHHRAAALEHLRQLPFRWEPVARPELSGDDLGVDLVVDRLGCPLCPGGGKQGLGSILLHRTPSLCTVLLKKHSTRARPRQGNGKKS